MKLFYFILSFVLLAACKPDNHVNEAEFQDSLDSLNRAVPVIDEKAVASILEQIPSPLEISMLLKKADAKYNSSILNAPSNIGKYNSQFKKAINLGIYGADLGYTNIYGENVESIRYLSSIKSLANDLNIGQFFDIQTISKLASNSNNLDSMLLVTTQNFNAINQYLQNQNRANLSLLFLIGGWVEAMGILCEVAAQTPGQHELIEGIGQQKIVFEQLILLLTLYKDDPNMASLVEDFQELKKIFDGISIIYTYKESSMEVVDGVVLIKDNSTTTISITEKDALDIKNRINSIRTKITA